MAGRLTVRVDPGVYQHQKTQAVARQLGINPCKVVYHLTLMWGSEHCRKSGGLVLDLKPDSTLAAASFGEEVHYQGDAIPLLKALKSAGFLDTQGSKLWAHDWSEWQGVRQKRVEPATEEEPVIAPVAVRDDLPRELQGTNYFGHFMWWLVEGFGFRGYDKNPIDPGYFKKNGQGVDMSLAAEAYIVIATGAWGDDFDRRVLSGKHALGKVSAFGAFKRRKDIGTIIPLTVIGARYHPTAGERGGGMGTGDASSASGGSGSADPFAGGDGSLDLGQHPKYGG